MSQAEIEYSNVYPKYFAPLCENLSLPVVRGADSIVLTTLPSSTASTFATQYIIRLNDTMAIPTVLNEQVTFNATNTYTITGNLAVPAANANPTVATLTFATPFIPAWNSINAIAASYTVTLGSSSFTTPNVSRNCYALAAYGYDEQLSKHDYIDAASMPLYARAPALFNGGYGQDNSIFQLKKSTLKGPFVSFQNSTYGFDGNYNDMYGELKITMTPGGTPGALVVSLASYSWEKMTVTITNSTGAAINYANPTFTFTYTWTQRAPLQAGVTALCKKYESLFTNINQIQIQKNAVPNIAENAIYQLVKPFTNVTVNAGQDVQGCAISSNNNYLNTLVVSMTQPVLTAGDCNLYYKTMVFNNTRKYIPETVSILSRDYNVFQSQPIGQSMYFKQQVSFTSNTLNLPQVPQRIYIWCGYDTSALAMGSAENINVSNVPQCAIVSVQNISLGGRSICSGLSTPFLVNDVLCSKSYKPISEFGLCRTAPNSLQNITGGAQIGLSGNVLCIDAENMGLSEDQAAGLSGNSSMTFQFNITIALLDEYYQSTDNSLVIPSNTLQCFILCVSDRVLTFNAGNCSNTTQLFDASQLRQIRENPAIAMDLSRVMYGAGWWDDFTKGLGSVASKGLDALSWVADNGEKIMKTGEKFLPMLGLGHDDSEAGKRMNKKDELRRLLNR
jgi:hypothetical protein